MSHVVYIYVRIWYKSSDQKCIYIVLPESPFERAYILLCSFCCFIIQMNKSIKAFQTVSFKYILCVKKPLKSSNM